MIQSENKIIKSKVYCMMSGGVDSSVAATLLVKKGYDVHGVFMKNWSPLTIQSLSDCPWLEDQADARAVCQKLKIPFQSVNFEKEYRQKVVDYFLSEYQAGRTPNPDVMCNREIKFGIFLDWAKSRGADFVASGHYVRIERDAPASVSLRRGIDKNKDQSYFLWALTQDQLQRCLFPIGDLTKPQVRQIAKDLNLPTAEKKDSQGICFIGTINVGRFLRSEISAKSGQVIGSSNQIIGEHDGAIYYTIGQRHGFRLTKNQKLAKIYQGRDIPPLFVVDKDLKKNIIYIGEADDSRLYSQVISATDLNWINQPPTAKSQPPKANRQISAQIRYRQRPVECQIFPLDQKSVRIEFKSPVRAPTTGQSIVFYQNNLVLGGGVIEMNDEQKFGST